MSVTSDVTRHGRTVVETVKVTVPTAAEARKPLYASIGALDLAVARAKALPKTVPAELGRLQEQAKTLPTQLQEQITSLPGTVLTLPASVKNRVESLQGRSTELYADLAARGEKVVSAIRRQPSTEVVEKAAKATVRNAKATTKSASRTVKAAETAVSDAADTIG